MASLLSLLMQELMRYDDAVVLQKRITEGGFDINGQDENGFTLLHGVASHNSQKCTKLLLSHGADTEITGSPLDRTALHLAALLGSTECVSLLLEANANVHAKDIKDATALHYAIRKSQLKIAVILLDAGAEVDCQDVNGRTPLKITRLCRTLIGSGGKNVSSSL